MSIVAQSLAIELELQGQPQVNRQWSEVVTNFREGSKGITTAVGGTTRAAREMQQTTNGMASSFRTGAASAERLRGGLQGSSGPARQLKGDLDQLSSSGSRVGEVFKGALGAHLVAAGFTRAAAAARDFITGSVDATLQGQRIGGALRFAAGSAEAGAEELRFVREESERLGLQFNTTAQDYSKLAAASRGTILQGRATREIFTGVAEAATVLRLRSDETSGALNAIQQMMSKGTVQAEELRGQLGERIPGAFEMAARAMNVSTQELNKMLEQGQVLSSEFLPRFARELHRTFGADAVLAAKEGQAGINRFKTALFELSASFGTGFMVGVSATLTRLRDLFVDEGFRARVKELGETFGGALSTIVDNIGGVMTAGKAFFAMFAAAKFAAIVASVKTMGFALAGVVAANPILAAATVTVGAAVVAWDMAKKSSKTWHDELKEGEEALKRYNPQLDNLENKVKRLHEQAMKDNPFAGIDPDAGSAANRKKLTEDEAKTLAKVERELAQAKIEATKDGVARERALENLSHQQRLKELGSFSQAVVVEKQRHAAVLAALDEKEAEESASRVDKANLAFRERKRREAQIDKEIQERHQLEMKTEAENLQRIQEALAVDGFARQRLQTTAHFKEMEEAINKYARTSTEREEMLTELKRRESETRKRIDREEAASRMETMGALGSNLIRAADQLFSNAKKNALLHKTLAIAEIAVNTAVAVTKALAQGGFMGIPMALSIGALGAAQAFKVSQQKFAQGGIVQGPYTSGDRIPIRANAGEMILTRGQQAQLWSMLSGGGGSQSPQQNSWQVSFAPTYNFYGGQQQDLMSVLRRQPAQFGEWLTRDVFGRGYARMAV